MLRSNSSATRVAQKATYVRGSWLDGSTLTPKLCLRKTGSVAPPSSGALRLKISGASDKCHSISSKHSVSTGVRRLKSEGGGGNGFDIGALETYLDPRPASIVLSERNPPYTTHSCAYGTPRGYFIRCGNPGEYFPRFEHFPR